MTKKMKLARSMMSNLEKKTINGRKISPFSCRAWINRKFQRKRREIIKNKNITNPIILKKYGIER